jgi:hypothetical protein
MSRDELKRLPEDLAKQVLARAAELDASERISLSIPDLRSAAVEAGISQHALDQALSEVEAMQTASAEAAQETKATPRFKRRFIAAVAVIALLLAVVGSMMIVVPNRVPVPPPPGDIALPPVPPPPPLPPLPPGR